MKRCSTDRGRQQQRRNFAEPRPGRLLALTLTLLSPRLARAVPHERIAAPLEIVVDGRAPLLTLAPGAPSTASSSLSKETLRGPGESLGDVLERVPGLQIARSGTQADVSTASIRGAEAKQVPVYLGGIRLNDEVSGAADLSLAPLQMLERVDVYRGNAPFEADRLGVGGAIFLRIKRPCGVGAGAGGLIGSFGERGAWAFGSAGDRRAGTLLSIEHRSANNDFPFIDDGGRRFDIDERLALRKNADFSQTNAWAVSTWRLKSLRIHSVLNGFRREKGIAGIPASGITDARDRTQRLLAGVTGKFDCADPHRCGAELATSFVHAQTVLTDPLHELLGLRATALENAGDRVSTDLRLRTAVGDGLSLVGGAHVSRSGLNLEQTPLQPHRGQRTTLIGKAAAEWWLSPAVQLNTLAALECHTTSGQTERFNQSDHQDSGTCGVLEPVGRLGVQYQATSELEVLANVGRYVRPPLLSELYGSSAYVTGYVQLQPELGVNSDVGLRWKNDADDWRLQLEAFAFAREVRHLIRYRRSGPQSVAPFNVQDARILGTELAAALDAKNHVRLYAAATVLDPRETTANPVLDPTPNDILPFAARLTLFSQLELYALTPRLGAALSRIALAASLFHKGSRFADSAGQTVLPSQELVDLELTTRHSQGALTARASVRNLFNQQTLDFIGLPIPGRSYHAALEAQY